MSRGQTNSCVSSIEGNLPAFIILFFKSRVILGPCFLLPLFWGHNYEGESPVYLNVKGNLWPLWLWRITKCSKNRKQINKIQYVATFRIFKPQYWFSGVWPRSVEHAGLVTWVFPTDASHAIYLSIFMTRIKKNSLVMGSNSCRT